MAHLDIGHSPRKCCHIYTITPPPPPPHTRRVLSHNYNCMQPPFNPPPTTTTTDTVDRRSASVQSNDRITIYLCMHLAGRCPVSSAAPCVTNLDARHLPGGCFQTNGSYKCIHSLQHHPMAPHHPHHHHHHHQPTLGSQHHCVLVNKIACLCIHLAD